jgi:hypothetical protein
MKQLYAAIYLAAIYSVCCVATVNMAHAETTQVCVDVKDKNGEPVKDKAGKVKQNCKTMKKHEKLEGTKVPEKK